MNTITATSERSDRRPRPHTPWPLVQPPPKRVPKPTSRPASGKPWPGRLRFQILRKNDVPQNSRSQQAAKESDAPAAIAGRLGEQSMQDAADAGDAAVGGEQPHARQSDQRAAGEGA